MSASQTQLVDSLRMLAACANEQIEYVERMKVHVDELALAFDDAFRLSNDMIKNGELSNEAFETNQRLDKQLDSYSGHSNAHLWTIDALRSAPEWAEARRLAALCLQLLPKSRPNYY